MQLVINIPDNWPDLTKQQSAYIVSPASGNSDITAITNFLTNRNIKPILFNYPSPNTEPFLAHNDEIRLKELVSALYGKEANIIMTTRGGYGSARLIPELLKLPCPPADKLLIGFSDITSLHLLFNNHWQLPSLHAPVLNQCAGCSIDQTSINSLFDILTHQKTELSYQLTPLNKLAQSLKPNTTLAPLRGGNLALIQTSIGTAWGLSNSPAFSLLIEEYDEPAYSLDRMLRHLLNANIFNNCQALFIGDISQKTADISADEQSEYVLANFIPNLTMPIFRISNIGHKLTNLAIPLGLPIKVM